MKLYIAGPMSGYPQFNYPAFYAAATMLRDLGYDVVSPAEMDSVELQKLAMKSKDGSFKDIEGANETWGDMLARDVKLVADVVDGVCLLNGWEASRGARLEAFVAASVQKPVFRMVEGTGPAEIPPMALLAAIAENTADQGDTTKYDTLEKSNES